MLQYNQHFHGKGFHRMSEERTFCSVIAYESLRPVFMVLSGALTFTGFHAHDSPPFCCHRKDSASPAHPLSAPSGIKRYNTLDFHGKSCAKRNAVPFGFLCHETAGFFGFFRPTGGTHPLLDDPGLSSAKPNLGGCSPLKSPANESREILWISAKKAVHFFPKS